MLKVVAPEEGGGVPEEGETHPLLGEFLPGPAGMVGPVEEGLRVGHQAEDPSRLVADPGDGVHGAVGIRGIVQRCLVGNAHRCTGGDQVLPVEPLQDLLVLGDEFPLAVTDGQVEALGAPG